MRKFDYKRSNSRMASGDSSKRTTGKNRLILSDKQAAQLDTENVFVYSYGAETVENATKELFAGLRALDEQGATTILRKDLQKLV